MRSALPLRLWFEVIGFLRPCGSKRHPTGCRAAASLVEVIGSAASLVEEL